LSSLTTSGPLSPNLPAWKIRAPLPAEELLEIYRASGKATGIGWEYLAAINLVETRMGRIEGLSTAGATGPMQFLPSTWEECCEGDPTVDRDAILGAATYLVDRGGPEDMERALRGYNNSGYYVAAVSAYAEVLRAEPTAYYGYHAWEVFFRSDAGLVRLPVGYYETEPVDADEWIAANPHHLLS
ncbi:MAG: lytic transglycosylase domain-containing protein, partial [Acidimicrobiales bacterium]